MPEYAGFADLPAYLILRCRGQGLTYRKASKQLQATDSYIRDAIAGRITPSRERCDAIAALFGDSPRLVRILAGRESLPEGRDPSLDAILEVVATLAPTQRVDVLSYARFVRAGSQPTAQTVAVSIAS